MNDCIKKIKNFDKGKNYLVAIDSDGCVFDAMGIKQRECFCPIMIAYFGLQPVAYAARECKEFADLFSKTRGANRHKTIARILTELLPNHPDVIKKGFKVPQLKYYVDWVNDTNSFLSNEGLKQAITTAKNKEAKEEFEIALKWSKRVDEMVEEVCRNVPPFLFVKESLEKISKKADIIVCSSTPVEALVREWTEHNLIKYVKVVAGQEMGKKAEHLAVICKKYNRDKILMIGDAPGDKDAAIANNVNFYAINPGDEDESWKIFYKEAFDRFILGKYAGEYQKKIINEFEAYLPENPDWMQKAIVNQ